MPVLEHVGAPRDRIPPVRRTVVFGVLFVFWLVFSGHFDALHLSLGLVCAGLVAVCSSDLLLPESLSSRTPLKVWRYLCYLPWLLYQVILANLHVVYLVIFPHKIRPQVVRVKTGLTSDLALATLANSITVTPGTITMDVDDGDRGAKRAARNDCGLGSA